MSSSKLLIAFCKYRLERKLFSCSPSIKPISILKEAILEGIHCVLDETEYELHETSHRLLYDEAHTTLLRKQNKVGWEYFIKGFVVKEWGYIQGLYYSYRKLHPLKYTSRRWVVTLLRLLNDFRQNLWNTRNSALHGGHTLVSGKLLRQRLHREVRKLYKRRRDKLSLKDKDIFKLPLRYRLKQGNQHLLLWVKRAKLTFDHYQEIPIDTMQQQRITDWIGLWDYSEDMTACDTDAQSSCSNDRSSVIGLDCPDDSARHKEQMDISNWLKAWGDKNEYERSSVISACEEAYESTDEAFGGLSLF
jgi:hypothetical protein